MFQRDRTLLGNKTNNELLYFYQHWLPAVHNTECRHIANALTYAIQMRLSLITILTLIVSTTLLGQDTKTKADKSPWSDTTFIVVKLYDTISDKKVVAVEVGKKATIYVKLKPMMLKATQNLSNDFVKENYKKIIAYFNAALSKGDTILISEYLNLSYLDYLIAHQLIAGNANIYYKKQNTFVGTISHRLERYDGNADRFFYLPDKRPFFAFIEYSGILDEGDGLLGTKRYDTFAKEGEKLQSLRNE